MCANFGFFKPTFPAGFDVARLIRHLARKSQMYGDKSTGFYGVVDGVPVHTRYTGPASKWVDENRELIKEYARSPVLIGHTRWPTKGAVSVANTHPFKIGEWMVTHNGCISDSESLMRKARFVPGGETDSEEALVYVVGKDWSKESLCELRGGFAFTAAKRDLSEGLLVCDNLQRLWFVKLGDGFVWCTDRQILESSLDAAGLLEIPTPVKLEDQILHLHTGVIEPLGLAGKPRELAGWERELLERTRTGGRPEPKLKPFRPESYGKKFLQKSDKKKGSKLTPKELNDELRFKGKSAEEIEKDIFNREHQGNFGFSPEQLENDPLTQDPDLPEFN